VDHGEAGRKREEANERRERGVLFRSGLFGEAAFYGSASLGTGYS